MHNLKGAIQKFAEYDIRMILSEERKIDKKMKFLLDWFQEMCQMSEIQEILD